MKSISVVYHTEMLAIQKICKWYAENESPCCSCTDKIGCCGCLKKHNWLSEESEMLSHHLRDDTKKAYSFLKDVGYTDKLIEFFKTDIEWQKLQKKREALVIEAHKFLEENNIREEKEVIGEPVYPRKSI